MNPKSSASLYEEAESADAALEPSFETVILNTMSILASHSDSVRAGSWQSYLKSAIRDVDSLVQALDLPIDSAYGARAEQTFPVFVTLPFLSRMNRGDRNDPLLRQVLPLADEDESSEKFSADPLDEAGATLRPGLLQKYEGRVLLITTGACAIHCRYCFRRHFPYSESPSSPAQWQPAIDQIAANASIEEVILSGGDPLMLVDQSLRQLVEQLAEIKHLKRLRVHTRLPIMIPDRVTDELIEILTMGSLHPFVVIHANHANEIDTNVENAMAKLSANGITLLNQTVLLRGINDDVDALVKLSKQLLGCRVLPYYLHQLDPVIGAAHFEVPRERGLQLIERMRSQLPGYAVPRYVKELAGEPSKTVWA